MRKVLALSLVLFAATIVVPLFGAVPAAAAPPYSIKILSPATMAQVSTLGVQIRVQVGSGFILDQQNWGGVNITDHGHIHYFVDGAIKANTWLTQVTLAGLTPGTHVLRAELRNNDHSPLAPVVADSVTVTAGTPSIKILEPTKDESVSSLGFRVRVAVSNFTMSALDFGGWNSTGEGHMHIFDGGTYKAATAATTYTVTGWSAGPHTIKVELYNNNHTELPTEYSDSVNVTIATPSITLTAPASVAEGQDVTLTWSVSGFVMDAGAFGGWNETGRGHVHVFEVVNGVENYKAATAGSSWTFSGLSVGTHTFKVELYNNNHTELPTEYSSTKTVTVTAAGSPLEAGVFSPTVFYGSVVALVIVIVALAAMLVRKGRGGKPAPPPQM
jgi:hypothetical protein